jgi:hypothetical protein
MEDPLKLGFYVLLLLPGFIFVQVREYHLLREKRSQFEKSLDIILWSAAIWMVACTVPVWWPWSASRTLALDDAKRALQNASSPSWLRVFTADAAMFFGTVAGWSFVVANAWGVVRKAKGTDAIVHFITGRDWYPSVALKFFAQNIESVVVVETTSDRYLGVLHSGPDSREDTYIILSEVASLPKRGEPSRPPEALPMVNTVLIRFDDIIEIQALKPEAAEPIPQPSLLRRAWSGMKGIIRGRGEK